MQATGHRKQIVFFLISVILPSCVLVVFALRMIRQEKELTQKRILEERRRLAREIGQNLLVHLEKIKLQEAAVVTNLEPWQAGTKYKSPEVVLVGVVEGDRLLLPWELDRKSEESLKSLGQSSFREKIAQAEKAEFADGNPEEAVRMYMRALSGSTQPIQREYARLSLARALSAAGKKPEAIAQYCAILTLPSEVRDEFGIPLSYYAAGSLLVQSGDRGRIIGRLEEELQTRSWLSPGEAYRLRDLIETLDRKASKSADLKAIAVCRLGIQEHLRKMEQALALQRAFQGIRVTLFRNSASDRKTAGDAAGREARWGAFGEDAWLISLLAVPSNRRELLLAVEARTAFASMQLEGSSPVAFPQAFRLVTEAGGEGESPGENFRGLRIAFAENALPSVSEFRGFPALFYQLILLLVLSVTLFGAYLLWRDTRRELHLAEMRSQFVSSVSHELKTPLTAIRMFAETLRLGRARNEQMEQEYLDTIVNESERLTRLLNNVLDFSKIEKDAKLYRPAPADLGNVLRAAVRAMDYPLSQQGFRLRVELDDRVPEIRVDRDAIEQAVLNLLHNAMKYSGDARDIELRLKKVGPFALIQVVDRGIGIEQRQQKRIFEKFYRIPSKENERVPGTGLGLALVDHIVKAHGGRSQVDSSPGQGSTFSIYLPLEKTL